jgi:DNA replication protein DnaC
VLTVSKCRHCGTPVKVETTDDANEFSEFFGRLAIRNAYCQPCGEMHAAEDRLRDEQERAARIEDEDRAVQRDFETVVGRKYRGCSLGTFEPRSHGQVAALKAAKEFSTNPAGFLYLHGKPGVGKTHLAIGIYRENLGEHVGGWPSGRFKGADFWTVPELLLHLRSQIGKDVGEEEAIAPLLKSRLLILDDLGAEKMTDWVRQAFYVVISRRERDELPTVITSNLSLGEIEARVGDERITSRIGGAAKIVRMDGEDGRIAGAKRK